ncbi:hypothetical protein FKV24_008830, partial [Lysobacter maris]
MTEKRRASLRAALRVCRRYGLFDCQESQGRPLSLFLTLTLTFSGLKPAAHRRGRRPQRRPCLSAASLGAVPPASRRTGDRGGAAVPAG